MNTLVLIILSEAKNLVMFRTSSRRGGTCPLPICLGYQGKDLVSRQP